MAKVLLLNSGGIDSRLVAAWLRTQGYEIVSLYVDVGQDNAHRAKAAAQRTAEMFGAEHHVVTITWPESPVIDAHELRIIPYINGIAVSIGGAWARKLGIDSIAIGFKGGAEGAEFMATLQAVLKAAPLARKSGGTELLHPISECGDYASALTLVGVKGIPLDDTVSCGWDEPCTWCGKCKERERMGLALG